MRRLRSYWRRGPGRNGHSSRNRGLLELGHEARQNLFGGWLYDSRIAICPVLDGGNPPRVDCSIRSIEEKLDVLVLHPLTEHRLNQRDLFVRNASSHLTPAHAQNRALHLCFSTITTFRIN